MRQSESRVAALLVPPLRRLALLDDASPCLLTSALNIVTNSVALSPYPSQPCLAVPYLPSSRVVWCDRLRVSRRARVIVVLSCKGAAGGQVMVGGRLLPAVLAYCGWGGGPQCRHGPPVYTRLYSHAAVVTDCTRAVT